MKQYEYVNVVLEGLRAAEGWRYVGYIPTYETFYGQTGSIDLIFEKDVEE